MEVHDGDQVLSIEQHDFDGEAQMRLVAFATEDWTATSKSIRWECHGRLSGAPEGQDAPLMLVARFEPIGWAYWLDDHWHLCADEPIAHGRRKPVYIETIASERLVEVDAPPEIEGNGDDS